MKNKKRKDADRRLANEVAFKNIANLYGRSILEGSVPVCKEISSNLKMQKRMAEAIENKKERRLTGEE